MIIQGIWEHNSSCSLLLENREWRNVSLQHLPDNHRIVWEPFVRAELRDPVSRTMRGSSTPSKRTLYNFEHLPDRLGRKVRLEPLPGTVLMAFLNSFKPTIRVFASFTLRLRILTFRTYLLPLAPNVSIIYRLRLFET